MREAAITQTRVVGALVLREIRVRYGRSQLGYLWALAEPIAYIAAFSTLFSMMGSHPAFGKSMSLFFSLGILPFSIYRNLANQLMSAFDANEALLNFPIVKEIDTIFARTILEMATMAVIMAMVLASIVMLDETPLPNSLPKMMQAFVGLSLFGFGVGLINAVVITKWRSWQNIYQMMAAPLLLLSGVFYSLESMPSKIRDVLAWNPIIHGVEGMRDGYFLNYRASAVDMSYLFWCGLIATLIGLAAERAIRIR